MTLEFDIQDSPQEATVQFRGQIDARVGDALEHVRSRTQAPRLRFDCAGITRINSVGITAWLKALGTFSDRKYSFFNCTEQFIDSAVMIPQFPGKGWIESIRVQYCCDACRYQESRGYDTQKGIPTLESTGICPKCAEPLDTDIDLMGNLETLHERGSFKPR